MIQQSHQQLSNESFNLHKYLPLSSLLLNDSRTSQQPSILFTPENYMLVLSYCTSLEKEIQGLKNQLQKLENTNEELWNKNNILQTMLRQLKNGKNVQATPKFSSATSFAMINSCRTQRTNAGGSQQKEFSWTDTYFDSQIITLLKEENQSLKKKTQKLYKQNLKITQNYQMYLKLSLKDARNIDLTQFSDQQQLFQKVKLIDSLNSNKIEQNSSQMNHFLSKNISTNMFKPSKKIILSESNSCDISFQALPSFKSMDDMNNKNLKFDNTNFF